VVLCVTGGEALYADMGHFGKKPIRLAWFAVVMPCLVLNYFGQGALLLAEPEAVKNPFYMMAPDWLLVPLVGLATAATVIASQALITGAFSVTKQVVQMGFLPRLQVLHTSVRDTGQIYIPLVNWGLFAIIVLAVAMFKSSSNLAAAYGIAVCTDMLITTVLTFFVIRYSWKYPLWLCLAATGFFFVVDLTFWASNLLKLTEGGWFPLLPFFMKSAKQMLWICPAS
jgi:KUP system potassium uptake protein